MKDGFLRLPEWVVLSGLPGALLESCKGPLGWLVLRTVMELDLERNGRPGIVEEPLAALAARCGVEADKLPALLRKLRKAGVLRCFLPDHEDEPALLQVVVPLPTPVPWDEVQRRTPGMTALGPEAFAYATESAEDGAAKGAAGDTRMKEVVDLYLNSVSMKLNGLIHDELSLIARHYDMALIRRVFAKARTREVQGLSWVLAEIHREQATSKRASKRRKDEASAVEM